MSVFEVKLYGVRGSIPTPSTSADIQAKLHNALELAKPEDLVSAESRAQFISTLPPHIRGVVGGNSTCIHVSVAGLDLIFDGGSGCCELAKTLFKREFAQGAGTAHWFMTHTHQDHLIGLPMFGPLYVPGNHFHFYSPYEDLEQRLVRFFNPSFFPVPFDSLPSSKTFNHLEYSSDPQQNSIVYESKSGPVRVSWLENDHPGQSYSYRVDYQDRSFVLSTDAEYKDLSTTALSPTINFFRNADILLFDAQYAFTESVQLKRDWGHSSPYVGIDLALDAGIKKLVLIHHDPVLDDFKLVSTVETSRRYLTMIESQAAMEIELGYESHCYKLV